MLAMTALAYTMQSEKFARGSQDYAAAMTAAQSGVENYLSRLNRNDQYGTTVDCTNLALKGPMDPLSNTCGWDQNTAAGWLPVDSSATDPKAASFHFAVDKSARANGQLTVTTTGRVNGVYRTVGAVLGKGGSTDYVYYTDFESADPSNVQAYPPSGATVAECGAGGFGSTTAKYFYNGRAGKGCTEITFISVTPSMERCSPTMRFSVTARTSSRAWRRRTHRAPSPPMSTPTGTAACAREAPPSSVSGPSARHRSTWMTPPRRSSPTRGALLRGDTGGLQLQRLDDGMEQEDQQREHGSREHRGARRLGSELRGCQSARRRADAPGADRDGAVRGHRADLGRPSAVQLRRDRRGVEQDVAARELPAGVRAGHHQRKHDVHLPVRHEHGRADEVLCGGQPLCRGDAQRADHDRGGAVRDHHR